MGLTAARHVETAVGRKKVQHAINVVRIEGRREPLQLSQDFLFGVHRRALMSQRRLAAGDAALLTLGCAG